MNKEYTYLDGKVIIQDDDEKRLEEYQDNIDEILVQEKGPMTMKPKKQQGQR